MPKFRRDRQKIKIYLRMENNQNCETVGSTSKVKIEGTANTPLTNCIILEMRQIQQHQEQKPHSQREIYMKARNTLKSSSCFGNPEIQNLIKARIQKKLANINNKLLYPDLMGPHELYTFQNGANTQTEITIDLKEQLRIWLEQWLRQQKSSNLQTKQKVNEEASLIFQTQFSQPRPGMKYNKYSLAFKMNIVKKIQEQLKTEGATAKNLRHYIMREANLLSIHPKNIKRWFETKNLDRKQGGRKAKFPILQYKLANFIKENPNCKRKAILKEARMILSQSGIDQKFHFSKGWYQRFKTRLKHQKVIKSVEPIEMSPKGHNLTQQKIKRQQISTSGNNFLFSKCKQNKE